jgi:hypothetical protein
MLDDQFGSFVHLVVVVVVIIVIAVCGGFHESVSPLNVFGQHQDVM